MRIPSRMFRVARRSRASSVWTTRSGSKPAIPKQKWLIPLRSLTSASAQTVGRDKRGWFHEGDELGPLPNHETRRRHSTRPHDLGTLQRHPKTASGRTRRSGRDPEPRAPRDSTSAPQRPAGALVPVSYSSSAPSRRRPGMPTDTAPTASGLGPGRRSSPSRSTCRRHPRTRSVGPAWFPTRLGMSEPSTRCSTTIPTTDETVTTQDHCQPTHRGLPSYRRPAACKP